VFASSPGALIDFHETAREHAPRMEGMKPRIAADSKRKEEKITKRD
jgi:hypothetical protein